MGVVISVFGEFELRRATDGTEVLYDRVDGTVYELPTTVGTTADEAEEPHNRSEEEPIVA